MKLIITFLALGLGFCLIKSSHSATISNSLKSLEFTNKRVNILLSMTQGSTAHALSQLKSKSFKNRGQRLNAVHNVLKREADRAQQNVLTFLQQKKSRDNFTVKQLWVTNQIIVKGANFALIQRLAGMSDISEIQEDILIPAHELFGYKKDSIKKVPAEGEGWGVIKIEAEAVWANGTTGQGIVVGSIDTGVTLEHEAVKNSYRGGDYSWFEYDAFSDVPTDAELHGTHTMGTILGSTKGVGVAPGASWIACKMCEEGTGSCSMFGLLECGQWMACPTKTDGTQPDCTKAPHLVSNSWGWGGSPWYDGVLDAWQAGGIIGVFALGNEGQGCHTGRYPGNDTRVIAVGATDNDDSLAYFSSIGPNDVGDVRPDVAAPGVDVTSAAGGTNDGYIAMSGTSMACPHAAGLVTLLLSKKPDLTFKQVKSLLETGAVHTVPTDRTCGNINDNDYPNNQVGHGRINARKSYQNLLVQF